MARRKSRATRLSEAIAKIEEGLGEVTDLKDEMESWKDSIPENLQNGDKANQVSECFDNLEQGESSLTEAVEQLQGVEFPGMMG